MNKCRAKCFGRAKVLCIVVMCLVVLSVHAQDGSAGIQAADTQVRNYFGAGYKLMYAV